LIALAKLKHKGVWVWAAAAALLGVTVLFSSQAFSASIGVTAQPVQNSGAGGALSFNVDWSVAGTPGGPASASLIPTGDAHTKVDKPTSNQGTSTKLEVKTKNGESGLAFLQFDVSSIPASATIDSATMTMCTQKNGAAGRNYDVHRVTGAWTETGLTHANAPTVAASATDTIVTLGTVDCNQVWTVTSDVAAWVAGTATNYGLRIIDQDGSVANMKQTYNSRESTLGDPQKPTLDVDYTTAGYTMRHHDTLQTLNGSDQIISTTVEGTKDNHTGTINIAVNLLDSTSTIIDQGTGILPTASGAYSEVIPMTLGTIPYVQVAEIDVTYVTP
jgi:hypothetical protein